MFGTFRCNDAKPRKGSIENTEDPAIQLLPANTTGGSFPPHLACESCRVKKLRCDGSRPTCNRCRLSGGLCQYTPERRKRNQTWTTKKPSTPRLSNNKRVAKNRSSSIDTYLATPEHETGGTAETNEDSNEALVETKDGEEVNATEPGNCIQDDSDLLQPLLSMFTKDDISIATDWDSVMFDDENRPQYESSAGGGGGGAFLSPATSYTEAVEMNHTDPGQMVPATLTESLDLMTQLWDPMSDIGFASELAPPTSTYSTCGTEEESNPSTKSASTDCTCLQRVAHLLNNVTESSSRKSDMAFDMSLAYLKRRLQQSAMLLECPRCISRPEFCMLLILTVERIVQVSEKAALRLLAKFTSTAEQDCDQDIEEDLEGDIPCNFGSYSLSMAEHLLVSRTLVVLHLHSCLKFLEKLRMVPHITSRESQRDSLLLLEARVRKLIRALETLSTKTGN